MSSRVRLAATFGWRLGVLKVEPTAARDANSFRGAVGNRTANGWPSCILRVPGFGNSP